MTVLDPVTTDQWRVHNVQGLLHVCAGEMDEAGKEFDKALNIDHQATVSRGWYTSFLFTTGQEDEAVRLQGLLADESASNAQVQAIYGIYLSNAKRYDEAKRAFTQSLTLDRNCWVAHYGMAQMYVATGKQEKAREHSRRLEALVEPTEYEDMKRRLGIKPRARERSV